MADLIFGVLNASGIAHAAVGLYLVTRRRMRLLGVLSALVGLAVLSLSITLRFQSASEDSSAQAALHTDLAETKALTKANSDLQQLQQELSIAQRAVREARQAEAKIRAEADVRAEAAANASKALAKTTADLQLAQKELAAAQLAVDEARQAEVRTRVEAEIQRAAAVRRAEEAEASVVAAKKAQTEAIERAEGLIRDKIAAEKRADDAHEEATRKAKAAKSARKRSAFYQRKYYKLRQSCRSVPVTQKTESYSLFQLLLGSPSPQ